jgi:uncharacterized RDD family membrane protein YckC
MPCPLCGDICRCSSVAHSAAAPRWLTDAPAAPSAELEAPTAEAVNQHPAEDSPPGDADSNDSAPEYPPAWRQEVAARLNRYQARRKPRPPRYPSLRLRFEQEDSVREASGMSAESQAYQQRIVTTSNRALALDGFADSAAHTIETPAPATQARTETQAPQDIPAFPHAPGSPQPANPATAPVPATAPSTAPITAKIIEFPRSWTPPPAPVDELAEPVTDRDRPRILEAPEIVPPPPALGGITIEPAQRPELEKRPGIDIPLQSAPLARRIFSAAIDGVIIAVAVVLFGFIFCKMTPIRPPQIQILGLAAGLFSLFWAAYQYLLVVYSGTTPGLLLARLELARFDGSRAPRRLRRWRVLASFLSAVSLGMGYAWVFLDEDSLCWHDRITHTYLAPKRQTTATKNLAR